MEQSSSHTLTTEQSILPADRRPRPNAQIFLAPCVNDYAQRHFKQTVLDKVNVEASNIRDSVSTEYEGEVTIWGTGEGNESAARAMEPGDVMLFYVGENTYSHYAIVRKVERNPKLAEKLWVPYDDTIKKEDGENWPWVMYLTDAVKVDIDSEDLHGTLGWKQSYPLGFTRVADSRVDSIRSNHDSVSGYLEDVVVRHAMEGEGEVLTIDMSAGDAKDDSGQVTTGEAGSAPSLEELRKQAEDNAEEEVTETTTTTTRYARSDAVRRYALARADGVCEACGKEAPFEKNNGDPYLEVHHVFQVSDERMDDPDTVAAICPTCHRRIHHGRDGNKYNRQLIETLSAMEESVSE